MTASTRGRRAAQPKNPDVVKAHPWGGKAVALLLERPTDTTGAAFFLPNLAARIASYRSLGRDFPYERAVDDKGQPASMAHPDPQYSHVACELWIRIDGHPQHHARIITPTARELGTCSACHRPVMWAKTEVGKNLPVDPRADDAGNVLVDRDVAGVLQAWVLGPTDPRPGQRYMPHFATCPARAAATEKD